MFTIPSNVHKISSIKQHADILLHAHRHRRTVSLKCGRPLPVCVGLKMSRKPGDGAVTLNTNLTGITRP